MAYEDIPDYLVGVRDDLTNNNIRYRLTLKYKWIRFRGVDIAKCLKITTRAYNRYLVRNFNGKIMGNGHDVYFENKDDADFAAEWAQSVLLSRQLSGEI